MDNKDKNKDRDDSLRHLQACDQAGALMSHVAIVISSYYKALIENGLGREEALVLTTAYQNLLISASLNKFPPETDQDNLKNEDY